MSDPWFVPVGCAYVTDHYPIAAEFPERILGLIDGRGVLLSPEVSQILFPSLEDALAAAFGTSRPAPGLILEWPDGYPVPA